MGLGAAIVSISCVHTVNRVIVAPPEIPGATFVGAETCADCHDTITDGFKGATHSWLKDHEGVDASCEACHGPGSIHADSGGSFQTIVNPGRDPEACFKCHLDKEGQFRLAHRHPVIEGQVSCSDCHKVHEGDAVLGGGTSLTSQNDVCLDCHDAQRGPYAFEHEAIREGCTKCHQPHGSINNKMLTSRNADLCLKCHFQEHSDDQIAIGVQGHTTFLARGTCWSAGCHEAIHGSHANGSLRF